MGSRRAETAERARPLGAALLLIFPLTLSLCLPVAPASADDAATDDDSGAGVAQPGVPPAADASQPQPDTTASKSAPPAPVRQVGAVTVTATRAERDVLDVAGNVSVIDHDAIEQSGAKSLPELLQRQTGLFVTSTTTNPAGVQIEARGFNNGGALGSSLLVLVDGRRVNEADSSNTDWALLPLDEVESIEIVRGPASALYGDNAVGGVVNIRTRPAEGPLRAVVRGHLGRYDTRAGSLDASGTWKDTTGHLFAEGLGTDGYRHTATFERQDVNGSLETRIADRLALGVGGGWYQDDRGFPGFLDANQIQMLGRRAANPDRDAENAAVESRHVEGWLRAIPAEDLELRVQPYFRWNDYDSTLAFGETIGTSSGSASKQSYGVDSQLKMDRPLVGHKNRLIVGFDWRRNTTDRVDVFQSQTNPAFDAFTTSDNAKDVYAGFLQEELNLLDSVLLSAGFRYDRAEYRLQIRDLALGSASARPAFDVWSPKAALTWRFLPAGSVYFSYARGFRLPNFDEDSPILSFTPGQPPTIPDLKPQISDSFEIGAKWSGERVNANLALYQMNVHDEILLNPYVGFGVNDNFDRVRHRGIEADVAVQALAWLLVRASYTFEDVVIQRADVASLKGARMPLTPRNRGTVGFFATLPWNLEAGANALFVDERIVSNDFTGAVPRLDPYATLDLLAAWRPQLGEHLSGAITLALRNVTDAKYDGFAAKSLFSDRVGFYPAARFTWEVGLMLKVQQ